jgi:CheY-like chemotaxis protein
MREQPKVLVVDDEESVVVTIKAILQLDGYDVATTTSGAEARKMVRDQEFDLVLTDLRLEDGDGLEVLRAVREHSPRP